MHVIRHKMSVAIGVCTAVLAMVAAGCSSGSTAGGNSSSSAAQETGQTESTAGGGSAAPVTISYLTHWGPDQVKELQAVADAFHSENPNVTVKFQAVPFGNLLSTIQTQGASSGGATIASIYDLWLPGLIKSGVVAKAPADVSSDVTANWPAGLVDDVSSDGAVYGVPNEVDLYALNYNTKLFAEAGISAPPATWDELVADAAKLTDKATGQQGFGVITNWAAGVDHPFLSLAASNDGFLLNKDKTASTLTSPNVEATAELYETLIKAGSTDPSMSAANANTTGPFLDNFANGKTAMIIMANWWQSALKDSMGDNFKDVATAPIPKGPSGTKSSSISYSWMTVVNAHADPAAQDAAWKFLSYLNGPTSGKNNSSAMADILMGMGILPSRTSDLSAHSADLADPFIKTYVDGIADATPFPTAVGGQQASDALQSAIESLIFGKASAKDAMTQADQAVNAALASGK
jgi:multiple sugar transport system substrate-binding protein